MCVSLSNKKEGKGSNLWQGSSLLLIANSLKYHFPGAAGLSASQNCFSLADFNRLQSFQPLGNLPSAHPRILACPHPILGISNYQKEHILFFQLYTKREEKGVEKRGENEREEEGGESVTAIASGGGAPSGQADSGQVSKYLWTSCPSSRRSPLPFPGPSPEAQTSLGIAHTKRFNLASRG